MTENQTVVSIGLIREVFTSEFTPQLFDGIGTHEPALRLGGQLVRHTENDAAIEAVVIAAALPEAYSGDTLDELPRMIADARKKGFDKTAPKSAEFEMTERGLFHLKLKGKTVVSVFVSSPFEVLGLVRDDKSSGWSRYLRWKDADGEEHKYLAPATRCCSPTTTPYAATWPTVVSRSARASKLFSRTTSSASTTNLRLTLVYSTGWHTIDGSRVFALPNEIIGDAGGRVIYEANEQKRSEYAAKGTLGEWRQAVSVPAGAHALPTLGDFRRLRRAILHPAAQESGGIHLFGNSSTGKTTLLKLAASVWGEGGLVHSWRATANGLEGVADRTSDVVLILDELGQLDSERRRDVALHARQRRRQDPHESRRDVEGHSELARLLYVLGRNDGRDQDHPDARSEGLHGRDAAAVNVAADRGLGFGASTTPGRPETSASWSTRSRKAAA